ncbi:MAG: ROK family protein [Bacteroidales bacterium]|nr:ROK family protein [Bacteroidales bacterium]
MVTHKLIGVDIGGTKIKAGLIIDNEIVDVHEIKTPSDKDKEKVLKSISECIAQIMTPEVEGIGIGVPGMVDIKNGIVKYVNNIPSWKEVGLKDYLENIFNIPVLVNNDANCFVAGEKYFGKAQQLKNIVGITLGTGLGGGLIINDTLHNGLGTGAGEIGYLPYKDTFFEHYCSSQFFDKFHHTTGLALSERIISGDKQAQLIMDEFGRHLGELVKVITYILAPEAIVFGGSISKSFVFFEKSMWQTIHTFPFKTSIKGLQVFASEKNDMAVLGAAALYLNSL